MSEILIPLPNHKRRCIAFIDEVQNLVIKKLVPMGLAVGVDDEQEISHFIAEGIFSRAGKQPSNLLDWLAVIYADTFLEEDRIKEIESGSFSEATFYIDTEDHLIVTYEPYIEDIDRICCTIEDLVSKYDGVIVTPDRKMPDYIEKLTKAAAGENTEMGVSILFFNENL